MARQYPKRPLVVCAARGSPVWPPSPCQVMFFENIMDWIGESGPCAAKHRGWLHPITVCLLNYALLLLGTILVHDRILLRLLARRTSLTDEQILSGGFCTRCQDTPFAGQDVSSRAVSSFLAAYCSFLLVWRLITNGMWGPVFRRTVLYEYTWLCNTTLVLGAVGLRTCRPIMAAAFCVAVSIDQCLWYVDIAGWAFSGKFPVGVAKYLTWPQTSWATRITASHHMWTIPLIMYGSKGLHWSAYPLSVFIVTLSVLLSRWMTPFIIFCEDSGGECSEEKERKKRPRREKYLNINLSHEVWKDIKFGFLQICEDDPGALLYLCRLVLRWQIFNLCTFSLLYPTFLHIYGRNDPFPNS